MSLLTSPTLQNLLTNVRALLNQKDPQNSFWTDAELTEYLNEGVRIYFTEAVRSDEGYFTVTSDIDIVADSETVALPVDFFKTKNLWKKVSNGYILLPYRNSITDSYSTQGGASQEAYLPCYYFRGNTIVLHPTPNFSEVGGLKMEYIQFPDTMFYGGDSLTAQVSPIFKQLIEIYAVYKAKLKESMVNGVQTYAPAKENLTELFQMFKQAIDQRSYNPTFIIPFNPEF